MSHLVVLDKCRALSRWHVEELAAWVEDEGKLGIKVERKEVRNQSGETLKLRANVSDGVADETALG